MATKAARVSVLVSGPGAGSSSPPPQADKETVVTVDASSAGIPSIWPKNRRDIFSARTPEGSPAVAWAAETLRPTVFSVMLCLSMGEG